MNDAERVVGEATNGQDDATSGLGSHSAANRVKPACDMMFIYKKTLRGLRVVAFGSLCFG